MYYKNSLNFEKLSLHIQSLFHIEMKKVDSEHDNSH